MTIPAMAACSAWSVGWSVSSGLVLREANLISSLRKTVRVSSNIGMLFLFSLMRPSTTAPEEMEFKHVLTYGSVNIKWDVVGLDEVRWSDEEENAFTPS